MKFEWKNKRLIFNSIDRYEWMNAYAQVPTVLELNDRLRIFFTCRPKPDINNQYLSYIGFVDFDKDDLTKLLKISPKPIIELGNIGTFDQFGTMPGSFLYVDNVLYLYYTGWSREIEMPYTTSIGILVSKDNGETFMRISQGPCLSKNFYDPYLVNGPYVIRKGNDYIMFYSSCYKWIENNGRLDPVYLIKQAYSKDGVTWNTNDSFPISTIIEDEAQNRPMVFNLNHEYYMIFSFRSGVNFRTTSGYRLGLAKSKDLIKWERCDTYLNVPNSKQDWDFQMQAYPFILLSTNKYLLFYNGNEFGRYGFGCSELNLNLNN